MILTYILYSRTLICFLKLLYFFHFTHNVDSFGNTRLSRLSQIILHLLNKRAC